MRNEKWHLSCEIDTLKRAFNASEAEKQALMAKVNSLQEQYEGKLRLLRDSTEGEIRKESLRTKELELAMHHKDTQLKEALLMRSEKEAKDVEVYKQKAAHYENELKERLLELESVRSLHRKSEQRMMQMESSGADRSVEMSSLQQKLADAEEQLRVVRRELDERRTGAESLRAHSDSIALQFNDMRTRNDLLEEKVKSLTEQNEQLILRNKSSQSTFEDLQEKGSQVRRTLEEKVQQYSLEMEKLKAEAHECVQLRQEVLTLKDRIVGLSQNYCCASSGSDTQLQKDLAILQVENESLKQFKSDVEYWKEQHTVIARDIGRYQATNAANAVTIEGLEAQLAAEKSRCTEATHLAEANQKAVEIERKNYVSVQDVLGGTRRELEEMGAKWRASEAEVDRLKGIVSEFETERKTWTALHQSFMEAKATVERLTGELAGREEVVAGYVKTIEMLKADKLSWDLLQENYMAAKASYDKMLEEKTSLAGKLSESADKVKALEREKLELIGSLSTVSKEWEVKNAKNMQERRKELAEIEGKLNEMTREVTRLSDRNTLLSAEKIKYEQLQRDWDKHMITCNNKDGGFGMPALALPPAAPADNSVNVDGPTQIVVQCTAHGGGGDGQAAQMQELQEKNQLLQRLAGLHEAMEKIRYEPLGGDGGGEGGYGGGSLGGGADFHDRTILDASNITYQVT